MILHTIIAPSDVFADMKEPDITTELTSGGYSEYITVNGRKRLHRLFSTRPRDYLNLY